MCWELNVGAPLIGTETLPKMLKVQAIKMNSEITIKSHDKKCLWLKELMHAIEEW